MPYSYIFRPAFFVRLALVVTLLAGVLLSQPTPGAKAANSLQTASHMQLFRAINDARGKIVIVNFFASWCAPCVMETPGLINLRNSYPEDKVELLAIAMSDKEENILKFMESSGINYPVYMGADSVAQVFRVRGLPKMLVYDQKGSLYLNHEGYMAEESLKTIIDVLLKEGGTL